MEVQLLWSGRTVNNLISGTCMPRQAQGPFVSLLEASARVKGRICMEILPDQAFLPVRRHGLEKRGGVEQHLAYFRASHDPSVPIRAKHRPQRKPAEPALPFHDIRERTRGCPSRWPRSDHPGLSRVTVLEAPFRAGLATLGIEEL